MSTATPRSAPASAPARPTRLRRAPGGCPASCARAALAAWALLAACATPPAEGGDTPSRACPEALSQAVDAARVAAGRPAPSPPWAPPVRLPERSLPGVEGLAVDPLPLARGAHPVERWWRDPRSCQVVGGVYAGPLPASSWEPSPLPPSDEPLPAGSWPRPPPTGAGGVQAADGAPRALLVTTDDPGAAADAAVWTRALAALGARGRALHRPGRAPFEAALADLCRGLTGREAVLLVAAGPADPGGPAGPPALLLGPGEVDAPAPPRHEALSFARLAALLGAQCREAGLLVVVLDTSYAGDFARALPPRPPALVWTAGDGDAPRVDAGGGGLLTAALAPLVEARARAACLAPAWGGGARDGGREGGQAAWPAPSLGDVARAFVEEGVEEAMRAARWTRFGAPALGLDASPQRGAALRARVTADVPVAPLAVRGAVPAPARCDGDEGCAPLTTPCPVAALGPPGADGACLRWACRAGACEVVETPDAPCDDANPCTVDDACGAGGACAGRVDACDDGDPCTVDVCVADEGCVHAPAPAGGACDDGDACTVEDACDGEGACGGAPRDCDDGDPCTVDDCDPASGCVNHVENVACDDGDPCTVLDFCGYGVCRGQPKACDDGDPCTVDSCDPETGVCLATPRSSGAPCDDGDPCTLGDACLDGACVGELLACDDGLACTYDTCDEGVCHHLPAPGSCLGAQGCVPVGAHPPDAPCMVCVATNILAPDDGAPCADDGVACTQDVCAGGACVHPNAPGTCTSEGGGCVGLGELVAPCARCVGTGVAAPVEAGVPCDDGDACTAGDACRPDGQCAGEPLPCCPVGPAVTCGALALGDTSAPGATELETGWSCLPGAVFDGPEAAHPFTAPCHGSYTFRLHPYLVAGEEPPPGPDGRVLLFVRGPGDACGEATCEAYAQLGSDSGLTRELAAGEEVTLVVDGLNGAAGAYAISVTCPCEAGP